MTCDWGDCDGAAVSWRQWAPLGGWHAPVWLPVCDEHSAELTLAA